MQLRKGRITQRVDFIGLSANVAPMQPERAREHVAEEVRVLMARHRTTQKELAGAIGMDQTTLSRRINGGSPFDVDELAKIAAHFEIELTDLLPSGPRGVAS